MKVKTAMKRSSKMMIYGGCFLTIAAIVIAYLCGMIDTDDASRYIPPDSATYMNTNKMLIERIRRAFHANGTLRNATPDLTDTERILRSLFGFPIFLVSMIILLCISDIVTDILFAPDRQHTRLKHIYDLFVCLEKNSAKESVDQDYILCKNEAFSRKAVVEALRSVKGDGVQQHKRSM